MSYCRGNFINTALIDSLPNRLSGYVADAEKWENVLKVLESSDLPAGARLRMNSNVLKQRVVVYLEPAGK